ncbi:unnamed protein product [Meloidogyne enterolobii]|uniref:Uncharacterized protein n=1 Tax=Meloidogyne enterolobii TaxID=390850 RepID=A0ACB0YJJ9_MELEN
MYYVKFQSKVEELEKEKKCALNLYTNLEIKFEEDKNELIINLKADNDRLKIQVMEQSREEGLTSLKLSTENKKVQSENEQLKEKLKNYESELHEYSVKHEGLKKSIDELNNQITSMNELAKIKIQSKVEEQEKEKKCAFNQENVKLNEETFPGRFLGPGGRTQKELELSCRCKLFLAGKGVKHSKSEEEMHVLISPIYHINTSDLGKAQKEIMELFKLKRMDPVREAQLTELARIKQKLEEEKVAESERIEQERREEIKKCQEKKDKEEVEDAFTCLVCKQRFGKKHRIPVLFTCSHTFCAICAPRMKEENLFTCPKCRKISLGNILDNKNYQLIEAMEAMKMYEDDDPPTPPPTSYLW